MTNAQIEIQGLDDRGQQTSVFFMANAWHVLAETQTSMRIEPVGVPEAARILAEMTGPQLIVRNSHGEVMLRTRVAC